MKKSIFSERTVTIAHKISLLFTFNLLRHTIGQYYRLKYRPQYERPEEVSKLKPPYILLADHVHSRDMVIISVVVPPAVHWVAADANFRTPFMKFMMSFMVGAVAKAKGKSDMVTLSKLKSLIETGSVIGIYQEGERSWDGVGLPPVSGTDKLIRFLKAPVVYAHLEGAYLEHPRWTWSSNKTPIKIRYELVINREEALTLPLSEIQERIIKTSGYDEWAYQAKARKPLKGQKRAENVELVCFLCPGCHSVNTLHAEGNDFACSSCGLEGSIDEFGSFQWPVPAASPVQWPGQDPFPNVREWNLWQIDFYHREIDRIYGLRGDGYGEGGSISPSEHLFWEDVDSVKLSRGNRGGRMKVLGTGTARLYGDRIEFDSDGTSLRIPLDDISAFSVFKQFYTEFYYDKRLYQFSFTNRSVSGYKWLLLFRMILERKQEQ